MSSKIFMRTDGSFTMQEFEFQGARKVQNKSVVPPKYSPEDKFAEQRRKAKEL
ncbi:MAG: nucleolar RNA-binding Nop10p family protein [Candidatus Woesearchaeota archaeon]